MKKKLSGIIIIIIFMILTVFNIVHAEEYRLDSGDVLDISVWGFDELQVKNLIVRDDGMIAFPLVGEIKAKGLSPFELSNVIAAETSRYITDPKVIINVAKPRTTRIYILGEVARPGMYDLEKRHALLDALGAAGGYTKDALKKKIFIIRRDSVEKPIEVNLLKLLKQGDMSQNYVLNDGDAVYLDSNGRIDLAKDLFPFISILHYINDD